MWRMSLSWVWIVAEPLPPPAPTQEVLGRVASFP